MNKCDVAHLSGLSLRNLFRERRSPVVSVPPRSASRLCTSSLRGRRPFFDPIAYSQNSGNAIVESQ